MDICKEVLGEIARRDLLADDGLVVWESEREELSTEGWTVADRRSYGRTKIVLFARDNS